MKIETAKKKSSNPDTADFVNRAVAALRPRAQAADRRAGTGLFTTPSRFRKGKMVCEHN